MTQEFGPGAAKAFGDAHETGAGFDATESPMDLYNNAVGRAIGAANPDADICTLRKLTYAAYLKGELRVLRTTGNGPVPPGSPLLPSGNGPAAAPPPDPGTSKSGGTTEYEDGAYGTAWRRNNAPGSGNGNNN